MKSFVLIGGGDSDAFRKLITSKQSQANIPYKKNRVYLNIRIGIYIKSDIW